MALRSCIHYRVSGQVQGVSYRAAAQAAALHLKLCGWVRNMPDGDVEALACGSVDALQEFTAWLWQGPAQARVTRVVQTPVSDPACSDFVIQD